MMIGEPYKNRFILFEKVMHIPSDSLSYVFQISSKGKHCKPRDRGYSMTSMNLRHLMVHVSFLSNLSQLLRWGQPKGRRWAMDLFAQTISSSWVGNNHQQKQSWYIIAHITYLVAGEKTSVCGGARDRSMVLPARGPLGFTFRSDDHHVRTFCFVYLSFPFPYGLQTCMIW